MQKELNMMKNENNVDNTQASPLSRCLQPLGPVEKPHRTVPLNEEFEPQLEQFQYGPSLGDIETFHGSLEGGSRKRKSMPTKMPPTITPEDPTSPSHRSENNNAGSPSLPLMLQQSPQPKYSSQMIDLCNLGFQFYRTLEHFAAKPIKQESVKPSMMWPNTPAFVQSPYSYYPKVHPGLMFPFIVPSNFRIRNPFQMKGPPEPSFRRTEVRENGENKQKVERVDVNLQIDDSYYVDVGGEQKRWQCPMCEKSYTSKYNLVTHILGHSGIKPHACSRCGKLFKQLSHLHTHMLTHQGTRPHKCQVCHKAFTQTSHLKRHMMQHSDIKPYNCRICGRGFAYPSELKAHESKHESGRENICVECGLDFPTLAQLKRHLTTHRGPIQYNCTECDKTFQYPSQLQNHMMKHKDIRPYICTECGMEFVQPHHLKQHSLTHKGVKEHKCGICGREFTLLANMKRHVLIHTNIRAYQCHLCFKSFVQKQTLKAHMIVHSDVKPFKCKLCGKEFNRMHNLMGHMHLHSDSKPFKCLYCPSKFTLKGNLTRHMKVKHGVMERGFHSQGFGRGRITLSQASVLRSLEQEEPFDLSQKSQGKGISFHSDGESAKGSSCQEEEEDNCYEAEQYSPGMYHDENSKLYTPQDLSGKPECIMKNFRESYCDEKEEILSEGRVEKRKGNPDREENQGKRNFSNDKECMSFKPFEKTRFSHSLPDYLYFKHRNKSLKELLERKMEKQAMLISI
ncbi:PREDICTED: zinc finger protein 366 [Crocodylus porosus]|uniref:Zinc finger protein 366 n=1 Tax=Crocodylus porosus TaxID=8502 RepID=A0A7M4DXE6_CROPO|nr:PREDICTED: zinc finger protein 366 [Crocodylus porosus]XP_019387823.1 PREDICTED: zinc finger protein 366 [Crocodylus porosus]